MIMVNDDRQRSGKKESSERERERGREKVGDTQTIETIT